MKVLIADSQAHVRSALRLLLQENPGIDIAGEASDGQGLVMQAATAQADLLLMDWDLPGRAAALPALRRAYPRLLLVILASRPEARREAINTGIDAFVSKGDPPARLLEVVAMCWTRWAERMRVADRGLSEEGGSPGAS